MTLSTVDTKVSDFLHNSVIEALPTWVEALIGGDLQQVEQQLSETCCTIFNEVMDHILPHAAKEIMSETMAAKPTNCRVRSCTIRLHTGHSVSVDNLYDRQPIEPEHTSRHHLLRHWKSVNGTSLGLCDRVGYLAMLSPSFDLASQAFEKVTTAKVSTSSVDKITNRLAVKCHEQGEENLALESSETLEGKRLQIGFDGGRSRIRDYTGELNERGNSTFNTPWVEPKLFVIHVLKEDGQLDKDFNPIYGCRFGDDESVDLMGCYLAKLQVAGVKEVQIVGDGASWIWNRVKSKLLQLGVAEEKITETIDYGHAASYLHQLVDAMPKRIGKKKRKQYLKEMKDALKAGDTDAIYLMCQSVFKRQSQLVRRWINYFVKHNERMQYADFESAKLSKGSGIVESAIRRVINLRFKNSSTFWLAENLEKLYFLRCAMLSGRWNTVIKNLANSAK